MDRLRSIVVLAVSLAAGCGTSTEPADASMDGSSACRPADCDDGLFCNGVETCDGDTCRPGTPPCAAGVDCDETADRCDDGTCPNPDVDGDGVRSVACGGADCDDDDPSRYPGNTEVCDVANVDEDCDPRTFGFRDQDMDGRPDAQCCNGETCGTDCDDLNPVVGMDGEVCDGLDNDCNGVVDDVPGGGSCDCTVIGATRDCGPDRALDGIGICSTGTETCAAGVWVCEGAVSPADMELCNGLDDNCDGAVDETFDCRQGESTSCTVHDAASFPGDDRNCGSTGASVCSALCSPGPCVAASEDCDYCDDDGDGLDDEIGMASDAAAISLIGNCVARPPRSSASCPSRTIAAGSGRAGGTGALVLDRSVRVGYGPVRVEGLIHFADACYPPENGGFAVAIYRGTRPDIQVTDTFGADHAQTGMVFEVGVRQTAGPIIFDGGLREVPSGTRVANGGVEAGGGCDDSVLFDFTLHPHSPIGLAGETRYEVNAGSFTTTVSGPTIYPGDHIRVAVSAFAPPGSSSFTATALNVQADDVCDG